LVAHLTGSSVERGPADKAKKRSKKK